MRVIKDNGHRYITDKDNTFIAIMDQNDRMLLKFDYDPLDKFYKVRAEHAFDFLDPAKASKQSSESAVALPNALIDEAERTYDASKVVQTISADHESTILACASYINSHDATLRSRIPGEHEVDAERGIRTVRESMRVKILELDADYKVPNAFLPWLAMDCTNTRNFIPNMRSSPRMPEEIVKGAKVNFRTDITASFGQLELVKTNNISSDGVPVTKQEYAIALGRVIGTTDAVWVYRMDVVRVVSRRTAVGSPSFYRGVVLLRAPRPHGPLVHKLMLILTRRTWLNQWVSA